MKKFGALIICLLMILTCSFLGGCAGFNVNEIKYYNEVVATVGNTSITRHQLLTAYNSYGQNYYVSNMQQEADQALESTLDTLIDREALYQYALDNNETYKPSAYQVDQAIKTMFTTIDGEMENYKSEAKRILNIKSSSTATSNETGETAYLYENYVYKKRAVLENGKISYKVEETPTDEQVALDNYNKSIPYANLKDFNSSATVTEVKNAYFKNLNDAIALEDKENGTAIYNKVISLLVKDLTESERYLRDENGKKLNQKADAVLTRYIEKVYKDQIKSLYIENIKTNYQINESLSANELLSAYEFLYNSSAEKYATEASYKDAMKNAGTDADSILYHHQNLTDRTEFGYFIHTLIKFTDTEKAKLDSVKDINQTEYENILGSISSQARGEDGLVSKTAPEISLADIVEEYNEIKATADYSKRLEQFIKFMFKYTEDSQGTLVSGMPYVVGTNGNSAMEEAFTNECVDLMKQEKGSMSNADLSNVDSLCISSYGIHFVFYVGNVNDVTNYLPYTNDITIEKLYETEINPLTHETYFDMLFDKVYPAESGSIYSSNTGYQEHEDIILETSKSTHKVVKYSTRIKATKVN